MQGRDARSFGICTAMNHLTILSRSEEWKHKHRTQFEPNKSVLVHFTRNKRHDVDTTSQFKHYHQIHQGSAISQSKMRGGGQGRGIADFRGRSIREFRAKDPMGEVHEHTHMRARRQSRRYPTRIINRGDWTNLGLISVRTCLVSPVYNNNNNIDCAFKISCTLYYNHKFNLRVKILWVLMNEHPNVLLNFLLCTKHDMTPDDRTRTWIIINFCDSQGDFMEPNDHRESIYGTLIALNITPLRVIQASRRELHPWNHRETSLLSQINDTGRCLA